MRSLFATLLALLSACGAATPDAAGPRPIPDAGLPPVDEAAVRAGVRERMSAQLAAIAAGDADAYAAGVAEDVLVIGTAAADVSNGRAALIAAMTRDFAPLVRMGATFEASSRGLVIGVGADAHSAWAHDTIDFVVIHGERRFPYVFQLSAVLAQQADGAWLIVVQHSAIPYDGSARVDFPRAALDGGVGPGAAGVAAMWADGSLQLWDQVIDAPLAGALMTRSDAARAAVLPGGRVGWLAGNVELMIDEVVVEGRLLLVAARDASGEWKVVLAHPSVARPAD